MPDTDKAPEVPGAAADQDADQPKPTATDASTPPAGADQDEAPSLFTDEETKGLSPDLQKRVQGMVKKFTQAQMAVSKDREQLAQLTAQLRELAATQPGGDAESDSTASETDELDALISKAAPADREMLRTLSSAIEARLRKQMAPVAESITQARFQSEKERVMKTYPDFDQVVNKDRARQIMAAHPGINSYEALYKLAKFEDLEKESKLAKAELQKLQTRAKQLASTEMPMGMSAETLENTEFESLTKEQRRKLSPRQLVEMAERALRNSR